jgi:hypothetical protein
LFVALIKKEMTCVWLVALLVTMAGAMVQAAETKIPVSFSGGHETDPKDRGRPVLLIAAALNVKPEVFRKAFSGVTPARGRGPTGEEARRNKEALMKVLGPYKVTNDRLDEVSNYYRYRPQEGELWPTKPAKAYAVVEDGKIKKIVITEPGSGYSSPPKVVVKSFEKVRLEAKVNFTTDLRKNGGIESIELAKEKSAARRQ